MGKSLAAALGGVNGAPSSPFNNIINTRTFAPD